MKFNHIIITTQDFPPSAGGIQTWCVQLAKKFADKNIKVTVITQSFESFVSEPFSYNNVEVIRLLHSKWNKNRNKRTFQALKKYVTPDSIILASNWKMGVPALWHNLLYGTPYFTVCHGLDAHEGNLQQKLLQLLTFMKSKVVIAVSNYTKNYMRENSVKSKIIVINNGAEIDNFFKIEVENSFLEKYKIDKTKFNILNIGRIIERKGFDYTIRAIAELPNVVFHIAGEGDYKSELIKIADDCNVADRVHFNGFIEEGDMNALFNAADLFVMPSRKVGRSVEGFGITYLEAAATSTPSIGSVRTGAEDAIENMKSGILVDGDNIESIREGIRYFVDNPDQLQIMGEYAAQRVNQFTWELVADRFLNTFDKYLK